MTWIVIGCVWVLACTVIAMLPIRRQIVPGVMLMMAGSFLIWVLIDQPGWLVGGIALFAFLSMFRNHMIYMTQILMGQRPEIPT
ncbi:MAG: DUF2484 family protein [Pseudomonadota bacterium]